MCWILIAVLPYVAFMLGKWSEYKRIEEIEDDFIVKVSLALKNRRIKDAVNEQA